MKPERIEEIVSGLVRVEREDDTSYGVPNRVYRVEVGAATADLLKSHAAADTCARALRTAIREALLSALREEREAVIAKCADEANAAAEALNSEKDDYVGACGAGYAAHRIRSLKDNPHGDPR